MKILTKKKKNGITQRFYAHFGKNKIGGGLKAGGELKGRGNSENITVGVEANALMDTELLPERKSEDDVLNW